MSETALEEPHVVVRGLKHRFASGLQAVNNTDLEARRGELIVVVGPSGCGKTTILNIVAGLIGNQEGTVRISAEPPAAGRKDVAYMFAQDALLPWRTVMGNVLFCV